MYEYDEECLKVFLAKQEQLFDEPVAETLEEAESTKKSSLQEHRADAQAPYADEGRGKLRKASGSRKQALIRRYPNGGTRRE